MERVSGDGFFSYRREVTQKRESRRGSKARPAKSFQSELRDVEESHGALELSGDEAEGEAAELLDAVFEAGDQLKRRRDTQTLMRYKEAVQSFLRAVVRSALDVAEQQSGSNILRRKRYALVQVVDAKLEQLAAGMVSSQRDQLDVLARIDEINGLLIDMKH